ncbi:NAD(P)/FAD-dependent oxidoreductase [Dongia deserti]|uniref:NAD(P)/FAD-dependent oxidoreductase n=1 Tax=Dongia deserti TaxID=2268030 RepID=UPI000E650DC8|nr:FAD-binding oxidoreductase [Dongia deserti]
MSDYIDCHYARTRADQTQRPFLDGTIATGTAVIGGGLAGLTIALELARAGHSVVLLEGRRIGWGASGRNGGFCAPGYAVGYDRIAQMAGEETARELMGLSQDGVEYVANNLAAFGMKVDPKRRGHISARRIPARGALERYRDKMATLSFNMRVQSVEETRAQLKSPLYFESIVEPTTFAMQPLDYALAMAREIERRGGKVFENSPALSTGRFGTSHLVATPRGRVSAHHLVICTGGYTGRFMPALRRAMLPIATYAMASECNPALLDAAIATSLCISDDRRAGDYYRRTSDGRVIWGGRITARTRDPADLAELLRRDMIEVYPQLVGLTIECAWSGLMAYARHYMPQVGRLGEGVWYCTAFGGHGLNTTAATGCLIAAAIAEGDDRYRLFAPFGLTWNGGPLGPVAAQLTYWKLQLQDWWAERNVDQKKVGTAPKDVQPSSTT